MRNFCAMLLIVLLSGAVLGQDRKPITLPGVMADGGVRLPNSWSIRPAGKQVQLGDFPISIALDGNLAAVLHAGYGDHEIILVDLTPKKERIKSRVVIEQTFGGLAFSPSGKHLFVGGGEFDVIHHFAVDGGLLHNHRKIKIAGAKFIPGSLAVSPDGNTLYVPGVFGHAVVVVDLVDPKTIVHEPISLGKDSYPFACLVDAKNERLYVSLWNKASVAVIDLKEKQIVQTIATEKHPTEMVLGPGDKTLFVACSNSTRVSVIDVKNGKGLETINCALYGIAPNGNTPNSLCLTPDGQILFVANADNNNLAVFNVEKPGAAKPLGFIPVGMYPTSVRNDANNKRILVANGRGTTVQANPKGPDPTLPKNPTIREYIAGLYRGTLGIIDMPNEEQMAKYSKEAYACSPLRSDLSAPLARPNGNPVPDAKVAFRFTDKPVAAKIRCATEQATLLFKALAKKRDYFLITESGLLQGQLAQFARVRGIKDGKMSLEQFLDFQGSFSGDEPKASPIKYCIYVVRENRTYDQVFGDVKAGNGDPNLCIFPEKVTPNAHRLAKQFVLLDNFYCDGEVSAEGHEWSMGAYCTDFVKRVWPLSYRGSPKKAFTYPAEGTHDDIARPAGGYLWDRCSEAKVSYRSYGEWVDNGKTPKDPCKPRVKALEGHIDPMFRGYDLDYPDIRRAERFLEELKRFEKDGDMPKLQIVRMGNDHTYGTKPGKPTPTAMVAENDFALGVLVEGISKSKFWKETAIFVVEDDAQNGSDHVDAHRTVALVISPYTQHGKVDSTMYSTASMLRTMELILGLRPMSQFDAAATPMYHAFQKEPKLDAYKHVVPDIDLKTVNLVSAWGAKLSDTFDFSKEDAADDLLFNEVIWRSVKGASSPMPPPVRAAFVFPHLPSLPEKK